MILSIIVKSKDNEIHEWYIVVSYLYTETGDMHMICHIHVAIREIEIEVNTDAS